ncbi:hypothetical protein MNB_SV-4-1323 [hydrothermal vent metagenome]|uniref:Lipoprotein n=1 Tax=hydrothermal vent metagenome TaxID=652676 RepID=A0A1W1E945_9ZZZZ
MTIVRQIPLFTVSLLMLTGCTQKAERTFYDKQITKQPIECMKLAVTPPDKQMEQTMKKLYHFTESCPYTLTLSYKSGIVCNSHYNAQSKALGKMPNSYMNLELRRGFKLLYSYYIDLDHKPGEEEIREGFKTLRSDLKGLKE